MIGHDCWLRPQVGPGAVDKTDWRMMGDTSAGCDRMETKEGKWKENNEISSLIVWLLAVSSVDLLSALGFSLSLLHSSLRLSQHAAHLIRHTGLRQLSLNTEETWTKIQMSLSGFTLSPDAR